MVEIFSNIW